MGGVFIGDVEFHWINHSTIMLDGSKSILVDPFSDVMKGSYGIKDIIVSSHSHFDHFDSEMIKKHSDKDSILLAHKSCDTSSFNFEARLVEAGRMELVNGVPFRFVEAYNNKRFRNPGEPFHPKGSGMGFVAELDGLKVYYAGDTDFVDEMRALGKESIDVAILPVGGTYTMDTKDALEAVKSIRPNYVIPIHYNFIDGTEADVEEFKRKVESSTDAVVKIVKPDN